MKKLITLSFALAMSAVVLTGCTNDDATRTSNTSASAAEDSVTVVAFCGTCGHGVSSTEDHVCDTDHAKCDCGFHKASELCCKEIEGGESKFFCATCGEEKSTDACCKADAVKCDKCGLHKGSALCCKLESTVDPSDEASDNATETTDEKVDDKEAAADKEAADEKSDESNEKTEG